MVLSIAALNSAAGGISAIADTLSLHTGDPGPNGTANEVSGGGYVRKTVTFGAAADGVVSATNVPIAFDGPTLGSVQYVGCWDGASFLGSDSATGQLAFNSSGDLNVTSFKIRVIPGDTIEPPDTIDNTGVVNVSTSLSDWLRTAGNDGDTFRLRRRSANDPGLYWVPQGCYVDRPMTLDLNGCQLFTGAGTGAGLPALHPFQTASNWPLHRYTLEFRSNNVNIYSSKEGARLQGGGRTANMNGFSPYGIKFDATVEGQAGLRVLGENIDIDLNNIDISFTHGDGVQLWHDNTQGPDGPLPSRNIKIHGHNLGPAILRSGYQHFGLGGTLSGINVDVNGNGTATWTPVATTYPGIHHVGRQGISVVRSQQVYMHDLSIWQVARAICDIETEGSGAQTDTVEFLRNECNSNLLNFIPSGAGPASNVTISDNVTYMPLKIDTRTGTTTRHTNWIVSGNVAHGVYSGTAPVIHLDRIDGLTVTNNFSAVDDAAIIGMNTGSSTSMTISPAANIQFPKTGMTPSRISKPASMKQPTTVG